MAKVLVADDDRDIRDLLVDTLVECGYEVIEAADGRAAFELACQEEPDLILLDVWMPALDGFEVLGKLRDTPNTRSIPVVLLTALRATSGEGVAMSLGVSHYITKPWEPGTVETAVRVALREAGHSPPVGPAAPFVRTGSTLLDQKLSGGIPLGSLTLVEKPPSTGKSALCQHFMYESLLDGRKAAYFASEHTTMSLADKMSSFGRDVSSYVRAGRLAVYPVRNLPEAAGTLNGRWPNWPWTLGTRPRRTRLSSWTPLPDLPATAGRTGS